VTRYAAVNEAERAAEQVDPGGDDRRTDTVVVEHQRFDEIIEVALVVRDIYRPPVLRRDARDLHSFFTPLDFPQDRIERMLERAIDRIALRGAELIQICVNPLPGLQLGLAMPGPQILRDVFTREHCLGDLVKHDGWNITRASSAPRGRGRRLRRTRNELQLRDSETRRPQGAQIFSPCRRIVVAFYEPMPLRMIDKVEVL
jgi:hypothetical protein